MGRFQRRIRSVVLLGALAGIVASAFDAHAAVICQRKAKLVIRATACKGKETLVQDLAKLGTDVGAVGGQVDTLADDTLTSCADATLTRIDPTPPLFAFSTDTRNLRVCTGPCSAFDGNQSGCTSSYTVTDAGATSCFYLNGRCYPCRGCGEKSGACTNKCDSTYPGATCADAARTKLAGGPGTEGCYRLTTQALCESAWHVTRYGTAASCYWGGSSCSGCGNVNVESGNCTNSCVAGALTCKNASLTKTGRCRDFDGNQAGCEGAWHVARYDNVGASCFWDAVNNRCRGCGTKYEFPGSCTNTCL